MYNFIFNDEELIEVLTEVENIMDRTEFDNVLWGGDLNWDPMRDTGFSETMARFMEKIGFVSVWERFPISHTHIHTDYKSTPTLDHFMVNEGLLTFIKDAGAVSMLLMSLLKIKSEAPNLGSQLGTRQRRRTKTGTLDCFMIGW